MSIRTLGHDEPLDAIYDELLYTSARLLKNKYTKDLAQSLAASQKRWEKVAAGQRAAWRAEIEAQAGVDEENDDLDDTVGDISNSLLHHENQQRTSPRYKHYFKRRASEVIGLALESELVEVRPWPQSLQTEPEADLQALGKQLAANLATGDAAVTERTTAIANTAQHRLREINVFIDDANAARQTLLGALITRAAQKKLSPKWPERFFRKADYFTVGIGDKFCSDLSQFNQLDAPITTG